MKTNIATTKEQSDRLLKCGVPAESADMCWMGGFVEAMLGQWLLDSAMKGEERTAADFDLSPAFSLSRLLSLLPKRIERGAWSSYTLSLICDGCFWDLAYSYARYCGEDDDLVLFEDVDPIEVCVKAVEWLTANGHQLNVIEKGGSEQ